MLQITNVYKTYVHTYVWMYVCLSVLLYISLKAPHFMRCQVRFKYCKLNLLPKKKQQKQKCKKRNLLKMCMFVCLYKLSYINQKHCFHLAHIKIFSKHLLNFYGKTSSVEIKAGSITKSFSFHWYYSSYSLNSRTIRNYTIHTR